MTPLIRPLEERDILPLVAAFAAIGWSNKTAAQYERYLAEQREGKRVTPLAFVDDHFVGYLNVVWECDYPPFREAAIPEIQDFNVLPDFQRRGIGSALMDEAERIAAERSPIVGIGVGMTADYGRGQRLYVQRGYVPDGLGLTSRHRPLAWGETIVVDDDLVLWFTKRLR